MDEAKGAWRKEDEEKCEMQETCGFRRVAGAILSTFPPASHQRGHHFRQER
jgi:hypothetical protein